MTASGGTAHTPTERHHYALPGSADPLPADLLADAAGPVRAFLQAADGLAEFVLWAQEVFGVPFAWFTADEAYGQNPGLRARCEQQDIAYVMATRRDHEVPSGLHSSTRVDQLVGKIRPGAWRRMSCGDGAHGPRAYDWVSIPIRAQFRHARRGWVLARRNITTGELAYYVCFGPRGTQLRTLVKTAGAR